MNVDKNVMIKYLLEVLKRETSENNRKKLIELGDLVAKEWVKKTVLMQELSKVILPY